MRYAVAVLLAIAVAVYLVWVPATDAAPGPRGETMTAVVDSTPHDAQNVDLP